MMISKAAISAALAMFILSPIEAGAVDVAGGSQLAARMDDGLIQTVQYRHPVHPNYHGPRPGYHPPGPRPGYYPPRPGYHPPGYRPPPAVGWVGRPGWYRWAPGGAIAAGAAIGVLTAAAAASMAGPPPHPGLCWYYTDPGRTQGFWDACP